VIENIKIIDGTEVETSVLLKALSNINAPIKICIGDDSQVTTDDFYIGHQPSQKTSYNFIRPIRLGNLLNAIEEKTKKEKQSADLKLISIAHFILDPKCFLLRDENKEIYLTEKETALLQYLASSDNAVSRKSLLEAVWGYSQDLETHTVETHLYRLRQKLEIEFNVKDFILFGDKGYYLNLSHNA